MLAEKARSTNWRLSSTTSRCHRICAHFDRHQHGAGSWRFSPSRPRNRRDHRHQGESRRTEKWPSGPQFRPIEAAPAGPAQSRIRAIDRDAAQASAHYKDEQRFAARGRSPTSLYACASSMRWRPATCDDDERPRLRLRARPPGTRCANGDMCWARRRQRWRTRTAECPSPCPAGRNSGLQWALKCGENSALARCAARRMPQGRAGRLQRRGGEGPGMVRDRSMVRRGGGPSGRNSDVDKRALV